MPLTNWILHAGAGMDDVLGLSVMNGAMDLCSKLNRERVDRIYKAGMIGLFESHSLVDSIQMLERI